MYTCTCQPGIVVRQHVFKSHFTKPLRLQLNISLFSMSCYNLLKITHDRIAATMQLTTTTLCISMKIVCLLPGPSGRFWVARNHQIPSAAGRAWCPRWSIALVEVIFETWLLEAVRGQAPVTRTSWPCFRRKAVSLPAGEPESLPWSFSKAQILWQDGSQSFQQPLNRPQAKEETQHRANQVINERRQS